MDRVAAHRPFRLTGCPTHTHSALSRRVDQRATRRGGSDLPTWRGSSSGRGGLRWRGQRRLHSIVRWIFLLCEFASVLRLLPGRKRLLEWKLAWAIGGTDWNCHWANSLCVAQKGAFHRQTILRAGLGGIRAFQPSPRVRGSIRGQRGMTWQVECMGCA
jgi:hypothetical protein